MWTLHDDYRQTHRYSLEKITLKLSEKEGSGRVLSFGTW